MHDGERLDVGDRELRAVRPPLYDCPTTRGFLDSLTGVYWASDCFATPMTSDPVDDVRELPPPLWDDGLAIFHHHALAPWLPIVDREPFRAEVERLRQLGPSTIASAHSPVITGDMVDVALDKLAALPDVTPPPHPDQAALEAALAGVEPG